MRNYFISQFSKPKGSFGRFLAAVINISNQSMYALSEVGESMRPILTAMQEWGTNYKDSL